MTPEDLRRRLALDYRVLRAMTGPMAPSLRAFESSMHRLAGREASEQTGLDGRATEYVVEIRRPMLAAPGVPLLSTTLLLSAEVAGRGYPMADPSVAVVSAPIPFCHRVSSSSGLVCLGSAWRDARGRVLLGHILVQTLRWLGFDEPASGDKGFNPAAFDYWRDSLGFRPLPSEVPYPVLPESITHGRQGGRAAFVASAERASGVLLLASSAPAAASAGFRPAGERR